MGNGLKLECKCGFELTASLGIGFLYPLVCDKTLQNIKEGTFGEELKELAQTIPNLAIHQEASLFLCDDCGDIVVEDEIDLCTPIKKRKSNQKFSSAIDYPDNINYVMKCDIGDTYKVIHSVEHKCSKCNSSLRAIKQSKRSLNSLKCPKCREVLTVGEEYLWD